MSFKIGLREGSVKTSSEGSFKIGLGEGSFKSGCGGDSFKMGL